MADLFRNGEVADAAKFNQLAVKAVPVLSLAALADYAGAATDAQVASPAGRWYVDASDTTSEAGDGVVVDRLSRRWRPISITVSVDPVAIFLAALTED